LKIFDQTSALIIFIFQDKSNWFVWGKFEIENINKVKCAGPTIFSSRLEKDIILFKGEGSLPHYEGSAKIFTLEPKNRLSNFFHRALFSGN